MIQPKEVQEEIKLPDPSQKPEPEPDYGDEGGDGDGVVGGVVGGAAAAGGGGGGGIEEAPVYAGGAGYASAREKERGCVGRAVRVPRELAGIVSAVTAKFAVRPGGRITDFTLLGNVPDKRIEQAVWNAIQECDWVVATDPTGKAVSMWVMLPLRFTSG
jgi:protein TonB